MNILILVRDYKSGVINEKNGMPAKSGAEIHVDRHAQAFREQGHAVTVMAKKRRFNTPIKEIVNGIHLFRLPSGFRIWGCMYYFLNNRKKIDVIYVFGQPSFNLTAILMAYLMKIPAVFVATMTGEAFETIKSDKYFGSIKPYRRFHNAVLKLCTAYIAISQEIGTEFSEHGFEAGKIYVLPQGVDTRIFRPISADEKCQQRKELGLPVGKKIVLFCSRLDLRKGIDILLATWAEVYSKCPEAHLVVVGGGLEKHIKQLQSLRLSPIGNSVTYIGESDEPVKYFQAADIFVFPSRREGCPNVLMEAMSCGCAPLVSKIGGCEDLVTEDETGKLFASEKEEEYKDKLISLLHDEAAIRRLGENARGLCHEKLDVLYIAAKLIDLFKTCIAKEKNRS